MSPRRAAHPPILGAPSDAAREPFGLWGRAFRPFFLAAAVHGALVVQDPLWCSARAGQRGRESAQLSSAARSSAGRTGFTRQASIPAAKDRSWSSREALAVIPMMRG